MIEKLGLERFYSLLSDKTLVVSTDANRAGDWTLYDETEFTRDFVRELPDGWREARLLVDGLTCYACVWLCEQGMRKSFPEAELAINLASGQAILRFPSSSHLSALVKLVESLGYPVTPDRGDAKATLGADVLRLGVAWFAFANVMLLAAADYFSAPGTIEPVYWHLFRYLSLALATLSIAYGASPLIKASIRSLRHAVVSIDLPLTVALVITYLYSAFNTVSGAGAVYFDSIAAIIALISLGRFLQVRALGRAERQVLGFVEPSLDFVRIIGTPDQGEMLRRVTELAAGDVYRALDGDVVPVRSRLASPEAYVSLEQITGEADPATVSQGQTVRAGAINLAQPVLFEALEDGLSSYLVKARATTQKMLGEKGRWGQISERSAAFFSVVVLAAAIFTVVSGWPTQPEEAVRRAVSILLIACPCVFGFGAPLVFARSAALALRRGIVFRSQRAIEDLSRARKLVFDKTGTLTMGQLAVTRAVFDVSALETVGASRETLCLALAALDELSHHHVARAVAAWARAETKGLQADELVSFSETRGLGVAFELESHQIRLGRPEFVATRAVKSAGRTELAVDGIVVASFEFGDELWSDARSALAALSKSGFELAVLSGDASATTERAAAALGLGATQATGQATPTSKALTIGQARARGGVVMIGNGINDSLAMAKATIGVAVGGASQAAKDAADVCLLGSGLAPLVDAINISRATRRALERCLSFAFAYNIVGIALAAIGHVTPVAAAILMPFSSVTVLVIATRWRA